MTSIPGYLTPYILIGTLTIIAALLFGLNRALKRARWPAQDRGRAFWSVAALLVGWYLATLLLAWLEFYRGVSSRIPTIQYGLLIPIIIGVVLAWKWKLLRRIIDTVPQEWIVGVQFYRALGLMFLVLYAAGRLPGVFALPAGIGDVFVGLVAPFVGIAYSRNPRNAVGLVRAWNFFGIVDLVVAVGTGLLTSPSPLQMLAFDAPNELISAFPLVMVPVFLVPLSILLHLASLKKLREMMDEQKVPSV
jgi:hypothetical protein